MDWIPYLATIGGVAGGEVVAGRVRDLLSVTTVGFMIERVLPALEKNFGAGGRDFAEWRKVVMVG